MNRTLTRSKTVKRQSRSSFDTPASSIRSVSSASSTTSDSSLYDMPSSPREQHPNNSFAYSNFYLKLPNGKWMLRYRTGERKILGTEEISSYYI
ncbi:hypothetical protein NQZ79_g3883 [Umbelopsis isabellina]|nr:hypothetical protein NQZ79_g3883 [Umbelopsis isabellina]